MTKVASNRRDSELLSFFKVISSSPTSVATSHAVCADRQAAERSTIMAEDATDVVPTALSYTDPLNSSVRPKPSGSLFAYFGKGPPRSEGGDYSGEEGPAPLATTTHANGKPREPPRKRRKKADEGQGQARLLKAEGGGWALARAPISAEASEGAEDGNETLDGQDQAGAESKAQVPANTAKRKKERKGDDELAEMRDMEQKPKRTMARRGRKKGQTGSRVSHGGEELQGADDTAVCESPAT